MLGPEAGLRAPPLPLPSLPPSRTIKPSRHPTLLDPLLDLLTYTPKLTTLEDIIIITLLPQDDF